MTRLIVLCVIVFDKRRTSRRGTARIKTHVNNGVNRDDAVICIFDEFYDHQCWEYSYYTYLYDYISKHNKKCHEYSPHPIYIKPYVIVGRF